MRKKLIPYSIILICTITLIIRAFYGFCWSDETFYSSTAYRFMCHDRLFIDDWFPTQLSGVVILPFLVIFKAFTGSMDGVILFLRLMYILLSFATACLVFYVVNKERNEITAYAASLMMLFYTHLNIGTLSYYTISVHCFLIAMLLIYHFYHTDNRYLLVIGGFSFALSVLALPTMAAAYVLLTVILFVLYFISLKKRGRLYKELENNKIKQIFLYTLVGIIIPALIFFIFLIMNVSIGDFIKGIPYVLSDEEHGTTLIFPLRKFFISLNEIYRKWAYLGYLFIALCIIFKKFIIKTGLRSYVFFADIVLFIIYAVYSFRHTGYIQSALCIVCLPLYILTVNKDKKLFNIVYLPGLLFSLVYSYSSNGFLYVLSMGHAIACVAGIVFIYDFYREVRQEGAIGKAVMLTSILMVGYVIITTAALRYVNVYRDAPLSQMGSLITKGPAKGIHTTAEHLKMYNDVVEVIESKCTSASLSGGEGNIFITKLLPFGYMCTDLRVAAPTTWRVNFNSERLREYYELNPHKKPDIILVLNEEYGTYETCGDVEYDPSPNANEMGGFLEKYIKDNDFNKEVVSCGIIYRK